MLSGVRPFASDSSAETIVAILTREPPPLCERTAGIPKHLERIVNKCLEKDRAERYQTMIDLIAELETLNQQHKAAGQGAPPARRTVRSEGAADATPRPSRITFPKGRLPVAISLATLILTGVLGYELIVRRDGGSQGPPVPHIESVAVLPFKSLGQEDRDEYLELGLADALIARLSSLRQILVRPTSAVRKYTDPQQDPVTAGRELKVQAVLEGSVQKLGDRVRVTVRLIRVQDSSALWSEKFDESIKDVLTLEDAISERVATALTPTLTGDEKKLLAKHYTENADAYREYLKGRYFWNRRTSEGLDRAALYFRKAIDIQPDYALAYAGLADCYMSLYGYCFKPAGEVVPLARASAARALELDDGLAEAHTSRACILFLDDRNWAAAESEFLRAIDLNPNYATARHWYSVYLGSLGRLDEAMREMRRAQDIDPLSPSINTDMGELLYFSRDYDKAVEQIRSTLDMQPDFVPAYWELGNVYERRQMYDQSIAIQRKALELSGFQNLAATFWRTYLASGYGAAMRMLLKRWKARANEDLSLSHSIGRYYAALGDKDEAFHWLERACEARNPWLINIKVEPELDSLRDDPRFGYLLRRMQFPNA
jgi:serine/threonine-protein kinase